MRLREMSMLVLPWLVLVGAGCGARTSPATRRSSDNGASPAPGRYGEEILADSAD